MFSQTKGNKVGLLLGFLFLITAISCHRFFMPVKQTSKTPAETADFLTSKKAEKYFILHHKDKFYALQDISVNKEKMTMNGKITQVDQSHLTYIKAKYNNYKYNDKTIKVLDEVHFYIANNSVFDTSSFEIPLSQVEQIEVIEHDKKRTTTSYVLGGIGIGVGALVLVFVIALLTKDSCPFISVYDGEQFQLQAELFGGAINRQLERKDYVPLRALPVNGEFQIRLSNELKEKQYTNFADLLVIEHSENSIVLPDAHGNLYQFQDGASPIAAEMNGRLNMLNTVLKKDNITCAFDDTTISSGVNELKLTFRNSDKKEKGKLLLHLKNSYWLDFLYGEFTRHFGNNYNNWKSKQQSKSASEMIKWTEEQNIPLTISVKTSNGWKEIQKIKTIGPLANRDLIVPVETGANAGEFVELRLQTGFMFWEIDYAAMDFSYDEPFTVTKLKPVTAEDQSGNSVLAEMTENDNRYLAQPKAGEYAILKYSFNKQPQKGKTYSVIFETSGYYEPIREYTGKADKAFLKKFRQPGHMAQFSLERYQTIANNNAALAIKK